jgi:hypothetical protein
VSDFLAFFQLGYGHIVTAGALDHILFLVVLAVVYRPRDWRDALWVISAFTVGHSLTLALAVTGTLSLPEPLVEFLIPLTIVAASAENVVLRDRAVTEGARRFRPLLAGVFGLVHGAGFAGYLRSLFVERIAVPLLGFNVGIEVGQILLLGVIGIGLVAVDAALRGAPRWFGATSAIPVLRVRVVGVSVMIGLVAAAWAVERNPW